MKRFKKLILEEIEKRGLKVAPLFLENKIYVDHSGKSWLVESINEDEVVATCQEDETTQTFSATEFAKDINQEATEQANDVKTNENKIDGVVQKLQQIGLESISAGQKMCDESEEGSKEHQDGKEKIANGHAILAQAEELKKQAGSKAQLSMAQQISQFEDAKKTIETGQSVVEQSQLIINDIEDITNDNVEQVRVVVEKCKNLIEQGCKDVVKGCQKQAPETRVSQQNGNQTLRGEVVEQMEILTKQAEELQIKAEQFIGQCGDSESSKAKDAAIVSQNAREIKEQAQKAIAATQQIDAQGQATNQEQEEAETQDEQEVEVAQPEETNQEKTEETNQEKTKEEAVDVQAQVKDSLQQLSNEVDAVKTEQELDPEANEQVSHDIENLEKTVADAQDVCEQESFDQELAEEKVEEIKAQIKKLSQSAQKQKVVLGQSKTSVKNIGDKIKKLSQSVEKIQGILTKQQCQDGECQNDEDQE